MFRLEAPEIELKRDTIPAPLTTTVRLPVATILTRSNASLGGNKQSLAAAGARVANKGVSFAN
jgi:hypothetical protein